MEQTERKVGRNSQVPSTLRRRNLKMVLLTLITSNLFCPHMPEKLENGGFTLKPCNAISTQVLEQTKPVQVVL